MLGVAVSKEPKPQHCKKPKDYIEVSIKGGGVDEKL